MSSDDEEADTLNAFENQKELMMKITKELLKRHGMGLCTTEERKAVEEWFDRLEGPMMSIRSFQEIEENKKETWNKLSKMVPELDGHVATDRLKSIPLYR